MRSARERRWLLVTALAVVLQVAVLYWPRPPDVGVAFPGIDLVVHLLVFGAVAFAGRRGGLAVVPLVGLLIVHAVASEVVQAYLVPERTGDWRDATADVVGTVIGALAGASGRPAASEGPSRATS